MQNQFFICCFSGRCGSNQALSVLKFPFREPTPTTEEAIFTPLGANNDNPLACISSDVLLQEIIIIPENAIRIIAEITIFFMN